MKRVIIVTGDIDLIPFLGTALGSAFVFFKKVQMPERVQKSLLGFASGVMVAASEGRHSDLSTVGFAPGIVLMMVFDVVTGRAWANYGQCSPVAVPVAVVAVPAVAAVVPVVSAVVVVAA